MKLSNSRRRGWTLFLVLLTLTACGPRDDRTPRQLLDAGVIAWKGGRVTEAERLLRAAVERAGDAGTDVHTMRLYHGFLFALLAAENRLADAERAYAAGVETTTDFMINEVAGHNLGVLRLRAGKHAEAAEILRATRHSLEVSSGSGDERLVEIMVLMHLDDATLASGAREPDIGVEVQRLIDDLTRFQNGGDPYLHPALLREIAAYSRRLEAAGQAADAVAVRDRALRQQARGADPSVPSNACLTFSLEFPAGCVLNL